MIKKLFIWILIIIIFYSVSSTVWADRPYEEYTTDDIYSDTIGILSTNSESIFKVYTKLDDGTFVFQKNLKVKDTIPVSNYGIQPFTHSDIEMSGTNICRYPILEQSPPYYYIVYDLKNMIWVKPQPKMHHVVFLDNLMAAQKYDYFINPFFAGKTVNVYNTPDPISSYTPISMEVLWEKYHYDRIEIIEQNQDFIKIGAYTYINGKIEPIGWVNIRDHKGRINVWVEQIEYGD